MKYLSIITTIILTCNISSYTDAHGIAHALKMGIRGIYYASSAALAYSSYLETMDIRKSKGTVIPFIQEGNTHNALICSATGLGIVGTTQLICKQALKRNTPILAACIATDIVARFVQNDYNKPHLPHYERAQRKIANFCATIQNRIC